MASLTTDSDALRDILSWSSNRPMWQRDALRRLVVQAELTEQDITDLTKLCQNPRRTSNPLEAHHLGTQTSGAPTIALKAIRGVQNVNALAEAQTVTFIPKGVTIVYGDNGAGKSGYVRILKQACRARKRKGSEELILSNVYEKRQGPQRAELEYLADGQSQKAEWKSDQPAPALLTEISVFDSRTANIHVEETSDLAYTPYPMKLLERLVDACRRVKRALDAEIAAIQSQTPKSISDPKCTTDTRTGKLIHSLDQNTNEALVGQLASLSEIEIARLAELESDFAQDSKTVARRLQSHRSRLERLKGRIVDLEAMINSESASKLSLLAQDLSSKRQAARLAASEFAMEEPIKGVGTAPWRKLWEAAREFSIQEAYPENGFPNVSEEVRCVLCQQTLSEDAAWRLQRFEAFVQDRTQREESVAATALENYRDRLASKKISWREQFDARSFLQTELQSQDLAIRVRNFLSQAHWRLRAVLRANSDVELATPSLVDVAVDAAIKELDGRIKALLEDDDSDERKTLRVELDELRDRRSLASVQEDVLAEINRRKSIASLQAALKDTRPNEITAKNTTFSKSLVTERLRGRFTREIEKLDLKGLAIELTQAGSQYGISRFSIGLIDGSTSHVGQVLSEGEYRCVALAGFLAELVTNNSDSGIIFDDPVSSLDHLHREAIAKRLAEEGRRRQIIVFTHDLPFLFLLRNACTQVEDPSEQTEVALRHIMKREGTPGYSKNEAPEKAQDATTRLKQISAHLENTRVLYEQDPYGTTWLITARGIIDSLRQTWEVAVEDAISPVLRTFSSKINTRGFVKLSAITQEDADSMRKHYGRCSTLLHKASDAMNPAAPNPSEIEEEIHSLGSWLQSVSNRQKRIETV